MAPSAHEPPVSKPATAPAPPPTNVAENLTIAEARDLLDWLEGQGIQAHDVTLGPDGKMTVRWSP